jgi:hypothetical protein
MSHISVPDHYRKGAIQPVEAIMDWELGFTLGNVVKYVARAGKKESATRQDDLMKALWYLVYELTSGDVEFTDKFIKSYREKE